MFTRKMLKTLFVSPFSRIRAWSNYFHLMVKTIRFIYAFWMATIRMKIHSGADSYIDISTWILLRTIIFLSTQHMKLYDVSFSISSQAKMHVSGFCLHISFNVLLLIKYRSGSITFSQLCVKPSNKLNLATFELIPKD